MTGIIAFVLKGYPRLSETFIAQEILALERCGLKILIYSLRHPTDIKTHPIHREISARVHYLPEYLVNEPRRLITTVFASLANPRFYLALAAWVKDWVRDPSVNRARRFGQAVILANELPDKVNSIHAHFLHTPASVCRYASIIRRMPWTCSAHAKDIWTTPEWEKREKLKSCSWLTTCTLHGAQALKSLARDPAKVHLVYHGLDLQRFPPPADTAILTKDGEPSKSVTIIAVGRMVPKKGFSDLMDALALLPESVDWKLIQVGTGPLEQPLRDRAEHLGIGERIRWAGAVDQSELLNLYRISDVMVLPCRIAEDGDRDGLPNVLMEAQSQGLPVVSTTISGIPEFIEHGHNGLLVPERSPKALSQAIELLTRDSGLRQSLGHAGQQRVATVFSLQENIQRLARLFEGSVPQRTIEPDPQPSKSHG